MSIFSFMAVNSEKKENYITSEFSFIKDFLETVIFGVMFKKGYEKDYQIKRVRHRWGNTKRVKYKIKTKKFGERKNVETNSSSQEHDS